jgi:hypothetical protein
MKPTALPLVALFAAACVGETDKGSDSGDVTPPMPPPDHSALIGLPPPAHTGDLTPPMPAPDHSGYIGTPVGTHTGGSGATRFAPDAPTPPAGLSPLPSTQLVR